MGSCSSEKNTYMRLALKKLLESKALSYLCDEEIKRAQAAFISQEPGESAHVYFFEVPSGRTDFKRSVVANVTFAWQVVKEKEPDGEGNLWASYTFSHTLSMRETYNLQGPTLTKWLQCVGAIGELDEEIRSLDLPDLVREMTHSREEWAMLERREKKAAVSQRLSKFFSSPEGRSYALNLRRGGRARLVPLDVLRPLLENIEEKFYVLKFKAGKSIFSWRLGHYDLQIDVEENCAWLSRAP